MIPGLPGVRAGERGRVAFFLALGALVGLAQTVGLAGAEALFLARLGAARLPLAFVIAAAVAVAASLLYAVRVGRARNDRVMVELLVAGTLGVAAAAIALRSGSPAALFALLCLFFAGQAVLLSHFWTFAGDFFDTLAAKRVVPLFTIGMSAGGVLGGGCAWAVLAAHPAEALLVAWGLALAAAAGAVLAVQSRLPRWRALGVGEEDETSVAGLRAALRHVRRSALGRGLVATALAMVLALFVAQYLYSDVLARAFPDEAALARFLAVYLAASDAVEIAIEVAVAPVLIRRFGVPSVNLLHPLLTLLAFAGLGFDYRLPAAVAARANRELLESALAGPIRNLVYNALPARFRSRVRALLEGLVVYSGMAAAGLVLLALGSLDPRALAACGAALSGLYLWASLRVRRAYLGALADELRAGRLDLREVRAALGARELAGLVVPWAHVLREEAEPADALLELAPLLVAHGFADAVRGAAVHPSPRVRAACLEALAADSSGAAEPWLAGLVDADPIVRRAALRALPAALAGDARVAAVQRDRLRDADPFVRAEAARRAGAEGASLLGAMLGAREPEAALAALGACPGPDDVLAAAAEARLRDPDPRLRAAALEALARAGPPGGPAREGIEACLADPEPRVRRGAVRALARCAGPAVAARLAFALGDPAREVRRESVSALAQRGDEGAAAARAALGAREEDAAAAALRVLGAQGRAEMLRAEYRSRVGAAWRAMLLARALADAGSVRDRFLALACGDQAARSLRQAFRALARLEDERVVRSVERTLRFGRERARGDALEVLSHLGERAASSALVAILEPAPVEEKLAVLRALGAPPRDVEEARAQAAPWLRTPHELSEDTMQRLLSLRRVSLFSQLSLERLAAIEALAAESEYVRGEVIVREGDLGDDLFLLVEGEVEVWKGSGAEAALRSRLGPGSYFGEMAILDGSPRSATAIAASDARVIVLAGERLRDLLHDMPALAFDLLRLLAGRLRRLEEELAPGARPA